MEPFHGSMSRKELDAISTTRPIVISQYSTHEHYVNSAALKKLGITEEQTKTNNQADWATGHFFETGFFQILLPKMMPIVMDPKGLQISLTRLRDLMHMGGITTIGDMATGISGDPFTDVKYMSSVLENDNTPFRIQLTPDIKVLNFLNKDDFEKVFSEVQRFGKINTPHLRADKHVKLFSDGAFFGQMFKMLPPNRFKDGHEGEWIMDPAYFEKSMKFWWYKDDYTIHVHCNGSAGLNEILNTLEKLQKEHPRKDHRLSIEHFGESNEDQSARIAKLGAIVSANPYYLYSMGDNFAKGNLGMDKASHLVRLGSLVKNNVPFALHTDFSMSPAQPLLLAWIAANRITSEGTVMAPEERVPVYNALQAITSNAAFVLKLDNEIGSIKVGKKADFVILENNPLKIDPIKLKDIKILETVFEGKSFPLKK